MTGFSLIHHKPSHARTHSDPPLPHPIVLKLEEDIHNLKHFSSSSPFTCCTTLTQLCNMYKSIDELLCLPMNQQALGNSQHKKWVEEQLDDSINLLDLTSSVKDCMVLTREHIQDLHLAQRKKGDTAYVISEKKLMKQIKSCFKLLKQMDGHHKSTHVSNCDLMVVDKVLMESRETVIASFKSTLGLLLMPGSKLMVNKAYMWGIVSKDRNECSKEQNQRKELEESIEGFVNGLELLFRRFIHNRVSLLNILSL